MSATFPQVAFWVIFPLAALIVLSGWVMIIISAIKKLRSGKQQEENDLTNRPSHEQPLPLQPNWTPADGIAPDGSPAVFLP
jgi:L-asparagine transporter-like permease